VASTIGASSFGFIVPNDSLMKSLPDLTGHSVAATSAALPSIKATLDSASVAQSDAVGHRRTARGHSRLPVLAQSEGSTLRI
jgi:tRNA A37 threonylcarbamoyladenosine synthetase subunit TsaC/SUA5/YrdC